jgi:multiple sugar transport system permease protein
MSLAAERPRTQAQTGIRSLLARLFLFEHLNYKRQAFILLLPYLIGLIGLVALPALLSVPFAFTDYDALSPPNWVGLGNFQRMFNDRLFWNGISVSLFFILIAVPLRLLGAMLLAFLLQRPTTANKIHRVLVYLPTIVPDVAFALLWLYIFNPLFGPLNWILGIFGVHTNAWLLEPWPAKFAVVIMLLWPIGEGFILMMASLQDIPHELNESAAVDGASGRQRFGHITLPLLAPAMLLLLFRDTVLSFQATFVPAIVTMGGGGPYYATLFLPVYIWQNVSEYQNFGYAAAMSWFMYITTAVVIASQFVVARRWKRGFYD